MPAGEADPAVLPLTICNEAAVLASGNKYAGAGGGGGWREGGGGQVCTGQTLNLSVLSLNVKRELLRSATFYTQCLIPLCHAKQGANGEKWGEGVGGWGSGEVFPQVWGAS